MLQITQSEWDKIPEEYKGKWEPTLWNLNRVRSGELPSSYIGKRNFITYEEGHGTILLTEDVNFVIVKG